jgi:hypothetical protein
MGYSFRTTIHMFFDNNYSTINNNLKNFDLGATIFKVTFTSSSKAFQDVFFSFCCAMLMSFNFLFVPKWHSEKQEQILRTFNLGIKNDRSISILICRKWRILGKFVNNQQCS